MTQELKLYLALHIHKHGESPYFFRSPLTEDRFPRPEAMAKILDIDYEPELLETIYYFLADKSEETPTFDARWRLVKGPRTHRPK